MRNYLPIAFLCFSAFGVYFGVGTRPASGPPNAPSTSPSAPIQGSTSSSSPGAKSPSAANNSDESAKTNRGVRVLLDYFGVKDLVKDAAKSDTERLYDTLKVSERDSVKVMIAIVSDPIESSVHHFDQMLDAIQRGFEAEGYLIDRHDLPWRRGGDQTNQNASLKEAGALLFRRGNPNGLRGVQPEKPLTNELVLVLVVGENSIYGIHKEALRDALDFVSHWHKDSLVLPVSILGPTYSGSASSLQIELQAWFENSPRDVFVQILSGSMMAWEVKKYLEATTGNRGGKQLLTHFQSTTLTSKEILNAFCNNYLMRHLGVDQSEIVLLTEGNTAYGSSVSAKDTASFSSSTTRTSPYKEVDEINKISYPVSISQVRAAYEREKVVVPVVGGNLNASDHALALRLETNTQATDLPPILSNSTSAHVERVIVALLNAVRHEHRHYIGLMGTNVEDRLFLAQLIRYHCPNVHLFCIDNNLIYTNPRFNRALEGMMIASPYPLYPERSDWWEQSDGSPNRQVLTTFPSDEANGCYVACRVVIARLDRKDATAIMPEYGNPFQPAGVPSPVIRPPVWIMQVGRGGLAPVAILGTENDYLARKKDREVLQIDNAADWDFTLRLDHDWDDERYSRLKERAQKMQFAVDYATVNSQLKNKQIGPWKPKLSALFEHSRFYDWVILLWNAAAFAVTIVLTRLIKTIHSGGVSPSRQEEINATWLFLWVLFVLSVLGILPIITAIWYGPTDQPWLLFFRWLSATLILGIGIVLAHRFIRCAWFVPAIDRSQTAPAPTSGDTSSTNPSPSSNTDPVLVSASRQGEIESSWLAMLRSCCERFEAYFVAVTCFVASGLILALVLAAMVLGSNAEWLMTVERACMPFMLLCPLFPLAFVLAGFCVVSGAWAQRISRMNQQRDITGTTEHNDYLSDWKVTAGPPPTPIILQAADEAQESLTKQAAFPKKRIVVTGVIIVTLATLPLWLFFPDRMTMLSNYWEWALRIALVSLTAVAIALLSGCLAISDALFGFLNAFPYDQWKEAFGTIAKKHPLLRDQLRHQLFAQTPHGFKPSLSLDDYGLLRYAEDRISPPAADADATPAAINRNNSNLSVVHRTLNVLAALNESNDIRIPPENKKFLKEQLREALLPYIAGLTIYLMMRLSRRLLAAFGAIIILMIALNSYPFQPQRTLLIAQWCLAGAAMVLAASIFIGLNQNPTLSLMSETSQGMTWDSNLLSQVGLFVLVPFLTALSLCFPELSDLFSSAAHTVKSFKY